MVGVTSESEVEAILHSNQSLHRVRRRWVHSDLPIPINRHESEGRIDGLIHDGKIQSITVSDRFPVVDSGATERIDPETNVRAVAHVQADDVYQIIDIGI